MERAIDERLGFAVACLLPLACSIATVSAHGYWLDGGEFVAAATTLGISHPPGHPLYSTASSLFALLPIGPLAFRIAIGSAVCGALASGFLFRAILTTTTSVARSRSPRVFGREALVLISIGFTWWVSCSVGWWFQTVRPEVYALQAALLFFAIERLLKIEEAWPTLDARPLFMAAFAVGLALGNHHFLAILLFPTAAPTLARVYSLRGASTLGWAIAALAFGLLIYVYLPVRALGDPPVNLGDPDTPQRFWWVVTAEAFQHSSGLAEYQSASDRVSDVAVALQQSLGFVVVAMAILGAYGMTRVKGSRRIAFVWVSVASIFIAARAWLGFIRSNPDALGYLMPAFGALGALGAGFVVAAVTTLAQRWQTDLGRARLALSVGALSLVLGSLQVARSASESSLSSFTATDAFDELAFRSLPTRSVVLLHDPQTVFRAWDFQHAGGERPDITVVAVPFLTYPGFTSALVREFPELGDTLRNYLLTGKFQLPDLQTLGAGRPLFVELDPRFPLEAWTTIVPEGPFYRVIADGAHAEDRRLGKRVQREAQQSLARLLGDEIHENETKHRMLWRHYNDALFYAATGARKDAAQSVQQALALNPHARELLLLEQELQRSDRGEVDVSRFLPRPGP